MGRRFQNYRNQYGPESRVQQRRQFNYQFNRGIAWPNSSGRANVSYRGTPMRSQQFEGGRGRGGQTFNRPTGPRTFSGSTAGRTPLRQWQRPPMQPGRWQPRQHTPEAYYFDEQTQQAENNDNDEQQTGEAEETFHFDAGEPTTEEELISRWNDAFFSQENQDTFFGDLEEEEAQYGWQDSGDGNQNTYGDY